MGCYEETDLVEFGSNTCLLSRFISLNE